MLASRLDRRSASPAPLASFAGRVARFVGLGGLTGLALALAGCSGDVTANGEREGQSTEALDESSFSNDKVAFQYFVGKGLTSYQAAGIVGNLDQESGVNPNAVQGGGPGRGIAQWSVGGRWDSDSGDNAVAFARGEGASVYSLQTQLDFIWFELTHFSGYGLSRLKSSTNVTDATVAFETDFEGCGQCEQTTRINYAKQVLADYGNVAYAAQYVGQSFPLASTTITLEAGQSLSGYIELKNVGTKAWDTGTRLATTGPRNRASAFADASWVASNRPAEVKGTIAPGQTYKFAFTLTAPQKLGTYDEFFGVVQESVAWFSDASQGGPPDDQLEVKINVVAPKREPVPSGGDAGADPGTGTGSGDGAGDGTPGNAGDAPAGSGQGTSTPARPAGANGGDLGAPIEDGAQGGNGCTVAHGAAHGEGSLAGFGLVLGLGALARRRRSARR